MSKMIKPAAIVVGAAQGIGAATAHRLIGEAWVNRLVIADLQIEKVEALAAELRSHGKEVHAFQVDLSNPASITQLVRESGPVERIALVAGIMHRHPSLEITPEMFERVIRINTVGTYLAAQGFAQSMIDAKRKGAIVAVTSLSARRPLQDLAVYSASKAGITMALRVLGLTTLPHGIRINMVAPGATRTQMMDGADPVEIGKTIPAGRVNEACDIAAAISFLLSPDSEMIGLRELAVEGGSLLGL